MRFDMMLKVVCLIVLSVSFCECVFTPSGYNQYNGAPRRPYLVSSLANALYSSNNQVTLNNAAPKSANNLGPEGSSLSQPQYVVPQQPAVHHPQQSLYGQPQEPQQLQYGQQPQNVQPPQVQQPQQPQYGQQAQYGQPEQQQYGQQPQVQQPQQLQYDQLQQQQALDLQQAQYGQPQQPQALPPQQSPYDQRQQSQVSQPQQPQYAEFQQPQYGQPQQQLYGQQLQYVQPQQPQEPQTPQYNQPQQPQDVQPVQTDTAQSSIRITQKYFPNLQDSVNAFKSTTATETTQHNTESNAGTPSTKPGGLPFAHLRASFKRNSRPTAGEAAAQPAPQPQAPVTPAPQMPVTPAPQAYVPPGPQQYAQQAPQQYAPMAPQQHTLQAPQQYAQQGTQQYDPTAPQQHNPPAPQQYAQQPTQQYDPTVPQHHTPPDPQQYAQQATHHYAPTAPQHHTPPDPQQYAQQATQQYAPTAPQQHTPPDPQQYAQPAPEQYVPPTQQQYAQEAPMEYVPPASQQTSNQILFPHFARRQQEAIPTRPLPKPIGAPSPQVGNSTKSSGTLTQSAPFIISPADFDPNIVSNVDGTTPPMEVTTKPKILMNVYYSHDNIHKPPVGHQVPVHVVAPARPPKPPADLSNLPKILPSNNYRSYFEDKNLEKSYGVTKKQKYAILGRMNERRAKIYLQSNINVLRWNETLAERAAAEINSCLYFNKGNGAIYAMIYEKYTGTSLISEAVGRWADEKSKFRLSTPCNDVKSCRYSQIVWANTREVGCARQTCNDMSMIACMYDPPGNVIGEQAYKPGRACSRCAAGSRCNTDNLCEWI